MDSRASTVHISGPDLQERLDAARELLRQARYKQALRSLDDLLNVPVTLVDRLQIQAHRALGYALWKKPEQAIEDASQILVSVRADIDDLSNATIDWDYEKSQDVGHLGFLADVYQLRGVLFQLRHHARRAVEDLSLSMFMTADEALNALNYLQRAAALIELEECLDRACADLELAWKLNPTLVSDWLNLPAEGNWELGPKGVRFRHEGGDIQITPDKARARMNRIGSHWFRLAVRFGI